MTEPNNSSRFWALLIGIDHYLPNVLPGGGTYPKLRGCVRDIDNVETYLRQRLDLADENIIRLTAPLDGETDDKTLPTYENMVEAFDQIFKNARTGDQVYIHYSGHGGRGVTAYPEIKGEGGVDESLVPMDIGSPGTRYLRDVEMAYLLKTMREKGLIVTLVLDSCHSGGATRGDGGGAVRGIADIDKAERPGDSLVADREALMANWKVSMAAEYDPREAAGWLNGGGGYVLMAACRANELANEYPFDGKQSNGALTYWLLDSLRRGGEEITYRMLQNRIAGKIHSKFFRQTPVLEGDADRLVFGADRLVVKPSIYVTSVDRDRERLKLGVGLVQNIALGALFTIYPAGTGELKEADRLALVELTDVQPTESWGKIKRLYRPGGLDEGARAELTNINSIKLRAKIRLFPAEAERSEAESRALGEIATLLKASENSWIRSAADGEEADFQVTVNSSNEFEIWDPTGEVIPNLRPAVNIDDFKAAETIIRRLIHLTKYRNVKLIEADAPGLAGKLIVECYRAAEGGPPVFTIGEDLTLCIKNTSNRALNVAALNLKVGWGISQMFPVNADTILFNPGEQRKIGITAALKPGYDEATDILKVFATDEPASFRWLELPDLDQPLPVRLPDEATRSVGGLSKFIDSFADEAPRTRELTVTDYPVAEWTTAILEVPVRR